MRFTLLAVGRLRPIFRAPADEYLRRLRRYAPVAEVEVREAGKAITAEAGCRQEAARLRERFPLAGHVVVLDRAGKGWSSEQLAAHLDAWRLSSRPVALVLGGSRGLESGLIHEATDGWSLGPIPLPHELARVVVLEQLYRAWTILRGEPYHK